MIDVKTHLQQLLSQHEADLGGYAWEHESDRFAELVFCLLNQCCCQSPENTRIAVMLLNHLKLLEIETLATLGEQSDGNIVVLRYILERQGFSAAEAARGVTVLTQTAKTIRATYDGKIQRYLRRHGEFMRDELANVFANVPLNKEQLRYAFSHWLQNAVIMPVSMDHPAIAEFCKSHQVTREDLLHAADELDLNAALLDDLLEITRTTNKGMSGELAETTV